MRLPMIVCALLLSAPPVWSRDAGDVLRQELAKKPSAAEVLAAALRQPAPAPVVPVPKGPCSELCSCGCQDGKECTCHLLPTTAGEVWHVGRPQLTQDERRFYPATNGREIKLFSSYEEARDYCDRRNGGVQSVTAPGGAVSHPPTLHGASGVTRDLIERRVPLIHFPVEGPPARRAFFGGGGGRRGGGGGC